MTLKVETVANFGLQLKYGVVRFLGTERYHSEQDIVFQSDDVFEAIERLEKFSDLQQVEYTFALIINTHKTYTP